MFYICSAVQTAGQMATPGSKWTEGQFYIGGVIAGAAWTESWGHVHRDRRAERRAQVAEGVPRRLLLRDQHDEGQPRLPRAQQRRARGVRRARRQPALELPDRGRGEQHRHGLRARRQAVRRLPLPGEQPPGDRARRRALALRARRHDRARRPPRAAARAPSTAARAARRPPRATPRPARPSSRRTAPAATARRAQGGNGGPDLSGVTDFERVTTQVTDGGGGMPAFGDQLSAQQIADVSAFVTQTVAGGNP